MTQLALVIDLNVCVGCHACVTNCKQWNTSGSAGALADFNPYEADPNGTFFNRVQTFEAGNPLFKGRVGREQPHHTSGSAGNLECLERRLQKR